MPLIRQEDPPHPLGIPQKNGPKVAIVIASASVSAMETSQSTNDSTEIVMKMSPRHISITALLVALGFSLFLTPDFSRANGAPAPKIAGLRSIVQLVPLSSGEVIAGPGIVQASASSQAGILLSHGFSNGSNLVGWITIENVGDAPVRIKTTADNEELLLVAPGESMTSDLILGGTPQFRDTLSYEFLQGNQGKFRYVIRERR